MRVTFIADGVLWEITNVTTLRMFTGRLVADPDSILNQESKPADIDIIWGDQEFSLLWPADKYEVRVKKD